MSQKQLVTEKPLVFDSNCKQIIEFLARHHFHQAISLFTLQQPDLQLFWTIANFTFKQLDSNLCISNLKELNDVLKALSSPYQTIKASTDSRSWEKLLKILAWASKIVLIAPAEASPYATFCFSAYQESLKQSSYSHLTESFISSIPQTLSSGQKSYEDLTNQIESLTSKKNSIQGSLADDKLFQLNEDLYKEIEKLAETEEDYKFLYKYSQTLWEILRDKLGGRSLNSDLPQLLKQEQQEIHSKSIKVLSEIVELESFIDGAKENSAKSQENSSKSEEKGSNERQLLEFQENIEKTRQENSKVLTETKVLNEKISEIGLELNSLSSKYRKEQKLAQDIITEDREAISQHARVIADWLETIDLNTY